jgi:signal transduction histidine kinase
MVQYAHVRAIRGSPLDSRVTQSFSDDIARIASIDAVPLILEVVCRTTGMRFAAVARVTEDRWIACAVKDDIAFGLQPGSELKVETTICDEIRDSGQAVIIDHVAEDEQYRDHHTPKIYGLQSYISMPIILANGEFFGTLCAIDPRPARLKTPETIGMFKLFAELIAFHLQAHDRLAASQAALLDERQGAELREQFIAVLGHDLRNPLASIDAGARILLRTPLEDKAKSVVGMMQNSVIRMAGLIDNVLDFARGRLGGGLVLETRVDPRLGHTLEQVIAELRMAWPDRTVVAEIDLSQPINGDSQRLAQLFSNLLGNALAHGATDQPVRVQIRSGEGRFELSVANGGAAIAPSTLERLFEPFSRGADRAYQKGLGLGLYIASEIARAHGGDLGVVSTEQETRFTFVMPSGAERDQGARRGDRLAEPEMRA